MFGFFKRDPAQEKLRIPKALFGSAVAGAANACNILNGAGLKGKFSREALFAEVCGFHMNVVISTMSRVDGYEGSLDSRFDQGARFLWENAAGVLSRLDDPTVLNRLKTEGHYTDEDLALIRKLLFAEKTLDLAAAYFAHPVLDASEVLNVSEEDVLDFGRKYNPKLLAFSSEGRRNSLCAYIVRCFRLSHLEDIRDKDFRTSHVVRFNDALVQSVLELERNVEKLIRSA